MKMIPSNKKNFSFIKKSLTAEGKKLVLFLISKYKMTEESAIQLLYDGGAPLAMALLRIRE